MRSLHDRSFSVHLDPAALTAAEVDALIGAVLDAIEDPLPPVLEPAWVATVLLECHERGISDWAAHKAIECAKAWGTVQCLAVLDQEDRDAIEAILPMQPAGNWFRNEFAGYWVTN